MAVRITGDDEVEIECSLDDLTQLGKFGTQVSVVDAVGY